MLVTYARVQRRPGTGQGAVCRCCATTTPKQPLLDSRTCICLPVKLLHEDIIVVSADWHPPNDCTVVVEANIVSAEGISADNNIAAFEAVYIARSPSLPGVLLMVKQCALNSRPTLSDGVPLPINVHMS